MRLIAVVALGLGLLASPVVWGEDHEPGKKQGGRPGLEPLAQELLGENWEQCDIQQLVELVMMVRLSQELDLSEERTVVMVRRFQDFKERQKEVSVKRQQAAKDLKEAIKTQASDDVIKGKLDALMAMDNELVAMRKKAFEEVSSDLTTVQRAKLYVFLQEFEGQMRRLIEKARQRREHEVRQGAHERAEDGSEKEGVPGKPGKDEEQVNAEKLRKKDELKKDESTLGETPPEQPKQEIPTPGSTPQGDTPSKP